jgi:hypothetical protein
MRAEKMTRPNPLSSCLTHERGRNKRKIPTWTGSGMPSIFLLNGILLKQKPMNKTKKQK